MILDFGLIAELLPRHAGRRQLREWRHARVHVARGSRRVRRHPKPAIGTASGVTLYEALTGTIPFRGSGPDVLLRKRTCDPPAPAEVVPDVPADLSAICMGLLCRDPEQRLSGPEALRELARDAAPRRSDTVAASESRDTPFVGRDRQLRVLNEAFRAVVSGRRGGRVASTVRQASARARWCGAFSASSARDDDVVVLSGRCYENESVPYKALDGVVDDLSRYLGSIPRQDVESLMPPDVPALTRVFPVLLQVDAIARRAPRIRSSGVAIRSALRRRAFEALRELLGRLANRRVAGDLHRRPAVGRRRQRGAARGAASASGAACHAHAVVLPQRGNRREAVSPGAARAGGPGRVVGDLARADDGGRSRRADRTSCFRPTRRSRITTRRRMTREAGGSPFVLEQLARYAGVNGTEPGQAPTFAEMFDDAARCALTGCAPLPRDAGDLRPADGARAHLRRVRRRARAAVARGDAPLLPLHSQQRLVGAGRDVSRSDSRGARRADCPRRRAPDPRPHGAGARRAGEATTARRCSSTIAAPETPRTRRFRPVLPPRRRARALAFDRAAFFYRHALALTPASSAAPRVEGRTRRRARQRRPAGRGRRRLPARGGRTPVTRQRVELQRRGAEQFLIGGHIDRGLDLIRTVLAGMGMSVPRSPRAALLSLLWRRARLRWRGLRFVPRRGRRHRRGYAPSRRHLLVGDDGIAAGGHDQRVGFQRASPAHGARCRRTVPSSPARWRSSRRPEARIRPAEG